MKINSDYFLESLKTSFDNINTIFLYGNNIGLIEILYKQTLNIFKVNINDPFSVSKIEGEEFKNHPSVLTDNINTIGIFSEKRFILLDLMHVSITKIMENVILKTLENKEISYLLLIKGGNLKQSAFLRQLHNINYSIKLHTILLLVCFT